MDLTVYLFDSARRIRAVITEGISQLIHKEGAGYIQAEIPARYHALPGEYIGFLCVDGRHRLFEIDTADDDDEEDVTELSATDAAIGEMIAAVVENASLEGATAGGAAEAILGPLGFEVEDRSTERRDALSIYYDTAMHAVDEIEKIWRVKITASCEFDGNRVTGRRAVVEDIREGVFAGRIYERGMDADGIRVSRTGSPRPKIYAVGAALPDGGQLTLADAVWQTTAGDPADKPQGQTWVGVPEAVAAYPGRGQVFERNDITDPVKLLEAAWEEAKKEAAPEVTGTATVSDMESPGRAIRVGDLCAIRLRSGQEVMQEILDIDRNYVSPNLTKVRFGKHREPDLIERMAKTASVAQQNVRRGGGAGAKADKALWNIEVHAGDIEDLSSKYSQVKIIADANAAALLLTATKREMVQLKDDMASEINDVTIKLDAANAELLLKANQTLVTEQGERISDAEIRLDGAESAIELKADKITLNGYVTTGQLQSEMTALKTAFAANMSVTNLDVGNLKFKGYDIGFKHVNVMTDATISVSKSQTLNVQLVDGRGASIKYVTGVSIDKTFEEIYFLNYA